MRWYVLLPGVQYLQLLFVGKNDEAMLVVKPRSDRLRTESAYGNLDLSVSHIRER